MSREDDKTPAAPKSKCPRCGLVAEGVRCPRCNALKVVGCPGNCLSCALECASRQKG